MRTWLFVLAVFAPFASAEAASWRQPSRSKPAASRRAIVRKGPVRLSAQPAIDPAFATAHAKLDALDRATTVVHARDLAHALLELQAPVLSGVRPTIPPAMRARLVALACRALRARLRTAARYGSNVDILAVHAEEAGNLMLLARDLSPDPRNPGPQVRALQAEVEGLLHREVDGRFGALARTRDPGRAVREADQNAADFDLDARRLYRFGFAAQHIDREEEAMTVKTGLVRAVTRR